MNDNAKPLEDFWNVVLLLTGDAKRCLDMLNATAGDDAEGKSFWRRMYARAVFAILDGAVYGMMFHAFVTRHRPNAEFTPDELNRLESAYDFDEDSEAVVTFSKEQMLDDMIFAFTAFARVHSCDYRLPTHQQDWILIKSTARIRQASQTPREPAEAEIHDENIEVLLEGLAWFIRQLVDLIESCKEAMLSLPRSDADEDEIVM